MRNSPIRDFNWAQGKSLLCGVALLAARSLAWADADPALDFSATSNPNGVWSYGWSRTLGSDFILDTLRERESGLDFWEAPISNLAPPGFFPIIFHNATGGNVVVNGTVQVPPGWLGLHPGPDGEYAVLRFTAPESTAYRLQGSFIGMDTVGPTRTDVHIRVNGGSIFDSQVNSFGGLGAAFSTTRHLAAGDTVDFSVGYGANLNFFYDSTALNLRISPVPEPASISLLLIGLGLLLAQGHRRSKVQDSAATKASRPA